MAVSAGIRGLTVIERCQHWNPHAGVVTGLAQVCRQRMVGGFKCARADAIMTAGTGARLPRDGGMIEHDLQPVSGVVASVTGLRRGDVVWPLTSSECAVVTGFTRVRSLAVIERYDQCLPT